MAANGLNSWVRPSKGFLVPPIPPQKLMYQIQPFGATVGGPTKRLGAADKWMMVTMLGAWVMAAAARSTRSALG